METQVPDRQRVRHGVCDFDQFGVRFGAFLSFRFILDLHVRRVDGPFLGRDRFPCLFGGLPFFTGILR